MIIGLLAGAVWAIQTVLLGLVLSMPPMTESGAALVLAPFAASFLHDGASSLVLLGETAARREIRVLADTVRRRDFLWLVLASAIGGPIGMSGYVMAVNHLGPAIGAAASAVYPAIGALLAFFFLQEHMKVRQWFFLGITLVGVLGLGGGGAAAGGNVWLGITGAFLCAFGWGSEAVILAKCLHGGILPRTALTVRQTVSALIWGLILLPLTGGWRFIGALVRGGEGKLFLTVALAALAATVSYRLYYRAIAKIGASRAMALNITYTAWAILFTVLITGGTAMPDVGTLACCAAVVIGGLLASADFSSAKG